MSMIEYHLSELRIGELYWVSCAEIMVPDGRIYYVPVLDHLHADAHFGFPDEHYHIDGRFAIDPRMKHQFQIDNGRTSSVIVPETQTTYRFLSIAVQKLKCERLNTSLQIPENPTEKQQPKIEKYNTWYDSFIGRHCAGRRCPHLGTLMLECEGKLLCPLHNLTADAESLKVVKRLD